MELHTAKKICKAQEKRQLDAIGIWRQERPCHQVLPSNGQKFNKILAGSFSFRTHVSVKFTGNDNSATVNVAADTVVMPFNSKFVDLLVFYRDQVCRR
ncbi:MAG: XamI family restriction endonuclease [Deltaproteobacteria bacterium]|nr:XamI family restriction endonuclease [Deltaproteobacteria bacterium]